MKLTFALCLSAVLLSACSKKEADPQPADPEMRSTMTRTTTFPASGGRENGLTYSQKSMENSGQLDAKALAVAFDVPEGSDYISFSVPVAALQPNLQGTYPIQDRQRSPGKVAETWYTYTVLNVPGSSGFRLFLSGNNDMRGQLTVTAYDPQRRLLSGSFDMAMNDVPDLNSDILGSNVPLCNVKITGTFANLKLK